ncbi:hypothetical protein AA313_de0200343 [Arthrobotrys entomopaga]|nr:hypothetical protein AA313_de0200343 [Arthrobotrys entomopaga]
MKASTISGALLALVVPALATPVDNIFARDNCHANNCLRAVRGRNADAAVDLCFSALGRITTTTEIETAYTTTFVAVTDYTATATVYATTVTTVVLPFIHPLNKRTDSPASMTADILKQCSTDPVAIASACSCFLGDSTSTVTESATITLPVTATETSLDILTVDIPTLTVTSTCYPHATPAIQNGDFNTGHISPWTIGSLGSDSQPGTYSIVDFDKKFKASLPKPTFGHSYSKVDLVQNLVTCPGQKYKLSFWYKFDASNNNAGFVVTFVDGVKVSDIAGSSQSWLELLFGATVTKTFTATSTTTNLEIDLVVGSNPKSEVIYLDNVSVVPV